MGILLEDTTEADEYMERFLTLAGKVNEGGKTSVISAVKTVCKMFGLNFSEGLLRQAYGYGCLGSIKADDISYFAVSNDSAKIKYANGELD